jgi:O-antigen biosynthesis protein
MPHQTSTNDSASSELIHLTTDDSSSIKLESQPSERFVILPRANQAAENSLSPEKLSAAEVYVGQALLYFEQEQWRESIAACQEALRIDPKLGVAYKVWGNCLQRSGKSAEAIGIYAKAIEAKADMADIYCNLGSIYAKQRKWQQAIEHYQKSSIINPENATPYRNLARVWDQLKEYGKSADCFFKAIALQPNLLSSQNHFNLANNLLAEGNLEKAIACYQSSIDLDPSFLNAYARLADALEQDGQKDLALSYYKQLAQLQTEAKLPASQSKSSQQISALINPGVDQASPLKRPNSEAIPLPGNQQGRLQPSKISIEDKLRQYQQAAAQQPNSAPIKFELGQLYFETRQWQKAIAAYQQAIQLNSQEAQYHLHLGRAWTQVNNHEQANLAYYEGFSLKPEAASGKSHYLLGEKLLQQNCEEKAIACYRRAISSQPDLIEAYWRIGEIVTQKGDYKTAIACYHRAAKISPQQAQNYILLGKALAQQGNWQDALSHFQQAIKLEPHNFILYSHIGESLAQLERYEEAIQSLRQGISKEPQSWKTYHQLGNVLSHQELWQEAIGAYEKAIIYNEEGHSLSYHYLAQAHLELQQWQSAITAYSKAIELNATLSWSHYGLGSALLELKQWETAAEALSNSIKLHPDFDWAHHKLGNAKVELQDWDGAVIAYRRALAITPGLPKTEDKLNDVLHKRSTLDLKQVKEYYQSSLDREPESESVYFKALEVSPNDPDVYTKLAGLYQSQGNIEQAIAFYKIALQIQPDNLETATALKQLQAQLV